MGGRPEGPLSRIVAAKGPHAVIDQLLALERLADDAYTGRPASESAQASAFGGQTLAQGLAAASLTVDEGKVPISAQGFFLSAADPKENTDYRVERVRDGRSVSVRSVRAQQGEAEVCRVMANFQLESPGFEHTATMPRVPGPLETPSLFEVMKTRSDLDATMWEDIWGFLEPRYIESNLDDGQAPGLQQVWMRLPQIDSDHPFAGRMLLAYVSDLILLAASLVPHGLMIGAPDLPRATMTHAVHLHGDPAPGDWVFIDQRSDWAGHGRGLSRSHLFSESGEHLASAEQEGFIRRSKR